jgi:hypothetical protein
MKQYSVAHIMKPNKSGNACLASHISRNYIPENADASRTNQNIIVIGSDNMDADARQRLAEVKGQLIRKLTDDAVLYQQVLLTGSHDGMTVLQDDDTLRNQWINECVDFLQRRYGKENVVNVTVHLDETTMHIHSTVVPLTDTPARANSQKNLEQRKKKYKTKEGLRLSARDVFSKAECEKIQTDFHKEVMEKWGFARGVKLAELRRVVKKWNQEHPNEPQIPLYKPKGMKVTDYYGWIARATGMRVVLEDYLQQLTDDVEMKKEERDELNAEIAEAQGLLVTINKSVKAQTTQLANLENKYESAKNRLQLSHEADKIQCELELRNLEEQIDRKKQMLAEAESKYSNVLTLLKEVSALVKEKLEAVITDIQYMRRKGDNALFMKAKINGEQQTFTMLNSKEEKSLLQDKVMPEFVYWSKVKAQFPDLEFKKGRKM